MRRTIGNTLFVVCAFVIVTVLSAQISEAQQAARIDTVSPSQTAPGQVVTITGIGFGGPNVRITVRGVPAEVISATGSQVTFLVPYGIPTGPTEITATNPGGHTGRIAFFVSGTGNAPPAVDAGPDLTVALPNDATLNGTATDDGLPAGSVLTIQWSKVSGPGTVTFANPNSAITPASFSESGTYVLRLTASDSAFAPSDETTVTVDPINQPPVVNAGADLVVYLPGLAALNGTATDDGFPPGSLLTLQWSKVSGPGTVTFSAADAASTTASFSEAGAYDLKLTASDTELAGSDEATVTVYPANQAPVVSAGPDLAVYLPAAAQLNGAVIDDGLPPASVLTVEWSKVSGPGNVTFANANSANTTASFSQAGSYVLRLTASDTQLSVGDETTITVHPPNQPPIVNAGPDLVVNLPSTAALNGAVTDDGLPPGSVLTIAWSKVSGPGSVTFANANSASTTASFSEPGSYVLRLTASDTAFTVGDETAVTVYPANQPPVVNAGPDLGVYLPASAVLNGTVTDDGLPPASLLTVQWSTVSGPGTVTFSNANSATAMASFSEKGSYVLRLTASDTAFTVSDETTITVHPANQPPVVNAGPDLAVKLPNTATLNGSVSDDGLPPGSILSVHWSKVSGPATVTFVAANSASTTASFSEAGAYVLQLTASDSEFTVSDEVAIDVSLGNRAPVANAGADFSLGVTHSAHLDGSASSDPDGDPLTFAWAFVSVPAGSSAMLTGPATATPTFVVDRP